MLTTGERTLLFADLVDSTQLVAHLGDAEAAQFWADHDHRARELLVQHAGLEIDRTDGFFLLFERPADALRFASKYHRLTADLGAAARIGIHHAGVTMRRNPPGDVARGAKPLEVEGLAKPLAARIMALAHGGSTLLSADAAGNLTAGSVDGQVMHRHGFYRLKGIPDPVEILELAEPSMASPPPADSEKAYRVVHVDGLWRPVREVRHNLAPERDAFIGREGELQGLADRLEAGARLVTVLGPGGMGKTRLVRRYAAAWLGEWPGGVYFCDLSDVRDLAGIQLAVAVPLGVSLGRGDGVAQLGHAMAGRRRCLVILDNFEQVQAHAQSTVGAWLDLAPEACFVVTSRERLHLAGEQVAALEPLPLGDDAIELFAARARAQQERFALSDENRAAVADIVRLLDGLPLAIELAAARVRLLSPAQILARLKDRFGLLAGARGTAGRQATLRAAIDWSWDLLVPWERDALAQCSVFEGGFTLDAAEAVVSLHAWADAPSVLDAIQALADKSLLRAWQSRADHSRDAEPCFGMYLSIREYAARRLLGYGEHAAADAEQRHGNYFAAFGSDEALDALLHHGGVARRRMLTLELDNLVSACQRAIRRCQGESAARCFLAAWAVVEAQGPYSLATALGEQVAALEGQRARTAARVHSALAGALRLEGRIAPSQAAQARALAIAQAADDRRALASIWRERAVACHRDGHVEEAQHCFETALKLHEALNDPGQLAALRANLANLQMEMGQMPEAHASYDAAIALHRQVGNRAAEGVAIGNLGTLHHELGRLAEARAAYDEALRIHSETGNLHQQAITLCNLGILMAQLGEHGEAAARYRDALTIYRDTGDRRGQGVVLGHIGELHQAMGEFEPARESYDAALRIHREVGNRRFEGGVLSSLGSLLAARGQLDAAMRTLQASETALREVDDPLYLARVLCSKGQVALAGGGTATARLALAEAQAAAERLGAEPGSELVREIHALRDALARDRVSSSSAPGAACTGNG